MQGAAAPLNSFAYAGGAASSPHRHGFPRAKAALHCGEAVEKRRRVNDKPDKKADSKAEREARLAAALRANLKRRKGAAPRADSKPTDAER